MYLLSAPRRVIALSSESGFKQPVKAPVATATENEVELTSTRVFSAAISIRTDTYTSNVATAPLTGEKFHGETVVPMYGVKMSIPEQQLENLLRVVGNHASTEEEWVRACHLLGDYVHKPRRKNRSLALIPMVMCAALAFGFAVPWYNHYAETSQSSDWVPPPPPPIVDGDLSGYLSSIKRKIEARLYPMLAEQPATLAVDFILDRYGEVSDIKILKSSGDSTLDALAVEAVRQCGQFDPPPIAIAQTMEIQLNLGKDKRHRLSETP